MMKENREFIFAVTACDDKFAPQLSRALTMRTELISREKFPRLWAFTDKNNSRASGGAKKGRRVYFKVMGVILLLLSVVLLVPGLMAAKADMIVMGAIGFIAGVISLLCGGAKRGSGDIRGSASRFDKAAKALIASSINSHGKTVRFTDDAMCLPDGVNIAYERFERVFETEDIFALIWSGRITVLQKRDLLDADIAEFVSFLDEKNISKADRLAYTR